ncbi:Ran GTPase-activating protein [Hamiltosporidium tvaerminnensis]|uniref:Ran GTPase-activating protein n=1 Tax=Hamiltosporidium tvaerminnensis TaxID=1176355 RepID=A0A4V2JUL0_9MICR|nr:hypothetical protein LUQ84_002060 [Hamiltosporidium tvaerminnensis]TBU00312.1 Ran GTPase-activating protein [Hamiltosporidium tvaerminnensis]TBU13265.1 Ran GTPase-activating protein [Hamiltosporidium tvaerminnensis]
MIISIENVGKNYETKGDISNLLASIKEYHEQITEIILAGSVFKKEPLEILFVLIGSLPNLKKINLSRIFTALPKDLMIESLEIIFKYLKPENIMSLDISENALSCNFPPNFTSFLCNMNCMVEFKINDCGLGTIGGAKLAECLLKISDKSNLRNINISQNKLTSSAVELGNALEKFENLEEIRIQYNNIDRNSMDVFLKSFKNHFLSVLDIRDNFLSLEGCKILGEYFVDRDIVELRMGDCLIRDEGIKEFLKVATQKKRYFALQGGFEKEYAPIKLDLSYNDLTDEILDDLVKFIKEWDFDTLWIEGNEFKVSEELYSSVRSKGGKIIGEEDSVDVSGDELENSINERFNLVL